MAESVAPPSTKVIGDGAKTKFLEWARSEEGIEVCPDVDMFHAFKEGYRGVVATKDIAANVVLVRVARSCCIGPDATGSSQRDWKEAMASAGVISTSPGDGKAGAPRLTRACLTVLRLLHERGLEKESPFHAYLNVLPHDHRLPMEWNDKELELLQGTSVEPLVGVGSLESQYEAFKRVVALHPAMWKPDMCSKATFAKGVNWVRSRGFTVMGDPYMIPGADMFNHDPNKQSVQIGTDGEDHFVMKTVQPVRAGEEVFSSFGHLSNAQLLNSYGFVLLGNPFDTVLIPGKLVVDTCRATFVKLEGDKRDEAELSATWDGRLAMVASNGGDEGQQEAYIISKYDLIPENLAGTVQILTMSHDEELVYAAIAAVAQAKIEQYSPLLEDEGCGPEGEGIGADARTLAGMLANEEKGVLGDLRLQLMSEILEDGDTDDAPAQDDDKDYGVAANRSGKRAKRRKI